MEFYIGISAPPCTFVTMKSQDEFPIEFTDAAMEELSRSILQYNIQNPVIRIGVKALGAGSVEYLLAIDRKEDNDHVFFHHHKTWVIAPKDMMFVMGMTIDFLNEPGKRGFVFRHQA